MSDIGKLSTYSCIPDLPIVVLTAADYSQYCSQHTRRLRKALGLAHSSANKPYQKKETPDEITDSRYLNLLLFQAERAWAYAMELKRESGSESRKHFHVVKRLRRAAQHAGELSAVTEKHSADKRTQLDVKVKKKRVYSLVHMWNKEGIDSVQIGILGF